MSTPKWIKTSFLLLCVSGLAGIWLEIFSHGWTKFESLSHVHSQSHITNGELTLSLCGKKSTDCLSFSQLSIFSIFRITQLSSRFLPLCQIYLSQLSFEGVYFVWIFAFLVVGRRETDRHLLAMDICISCVFLGLRTQLHFLKIGPSTLNVHYSFKVASMTSAKQLDSQHLNIKAHLKYLVIMIISSNGSV